MTIAKTTLRIRHEKYTFSCVLYVHHMLLDRYTIFPLITLHLYVIITGEDGGGGVEIMKKEDANYFGIVLPSFHN